MAVGLNVFLAGFAILMIGTLMIVHAARRESTLWGLACLFFCPLTLLFVLLHWDEGKKGFAVQLLAGVVMEVGLRMSHS